MKALLVLLALASGVNPHYSFRGDRVDLLDDELPSCGAAPRLLADRYDVVIYPDRATVNLTTWALAPSMDGSLVLTHAAEPNAYTRMAMYIEPGGKVATLILSGFTWHRDACADRVRLVAR